MCNSVNQHHVDMNRDDRENEDPVGETSNDTANKNKERHDYDDRDSKRQQRLYRSTSHP